MFINPKTAIKEGWLTGITNPEKQIQPNAVDFTLDRLFNIDDNYFQIFTDPNGKEIKKMRGGREHTTDTFELEAKTSYDVLSNMYVKLPEGVCAMLIARSTFTRNGLFLVSGLYDSGFEGHIGCALHNMSSRAMIQRGSRVGQIMFLTAESAGLYAGGYNHGKGTTALHQVN